MTSPYDTTENLLGRIGLKSADTLGEQPLSQLARALVDKDNRLAFYVNHAGQLVAADGTVVVAGNTTVDFITVANAAARLALTTATVRNGDHVKETDTGNIYELVNDAAISTAGSWVKLKAIVAADITDATTAGKALLTAADAPAQRTALNLVASQSAALTTSTDGAALSGLALNGAAGETWVYEFSLFFGSIPDSTFFDMVVGGANVGTQYTVEIITDSQAPVFRGGGSFNFSSSYGLSLVRIAGVVTFDAGAPFIIYPTLTSGTTVLPGSFIRAQKVG